jgi:hypothetical protein
MEDDKYSYMGHIFNFIKIDWSFKVTTDKTRQWPYYINAYYKYTHGSFNIDNEIYYDFKNNIK